MLHQFFSILNSHHKKVINRSGPIWFVRHKDPVTVNCAKEFMITSCCCTAQRIPLGKILKFRLQDSGLDRIKPPVVPFDFVVILLRLPVITQHPRFLRDGLIIGRDRTCFAACTQVLAGVEAEGSSFPDRTGHSPTAFLLREILGAVGLASVFDDDQLVSLSYFHEAVPTGHLSLQMNRHDGCNGLTALVFDHHAKPGVHRARALEVFTHLLWVHIVGALVDVHEPGFSSRLGNRLGGRNKRMRHGNNNIAGLHAGAHQREAQCIRSAAHADAVFCITKLREVALELFEHRAADKSGGAKSALEDIRQLLFELDVRCRKIQERYAILVVHFCSPITTAAFVSMYLFRLSRFPPTMAFAGTSLVTTLPAPTIASLPTVTPQRLVTPEPIEAPFFMSVFSTFQSFSVCSCPSRVAARV